MTKVLVTDGMEKNAVNELKKHGFEVIEKFYSDEELGSALKDVEVVVVRSATKVREKHLNTALETKKLKLVIRGGVGIDNIDSKFAEANGIKVMNTPGASAAAVAELALAHMFALARFIPIAKVTMSEGKWEKKNYNGIEISGKTLGVVGMGRIGVELGTRAKALGMDVLYYDVRPSLDVPGFKKATMDEILAKADFVSLHIPLSKGQPAIIGANELAKMKKTAYLINCARGGVVDEAALLAALDAGQLAGAGVDVFAEEPTNNIALSKHSKVSVTPHIGAQTNEAQERIGAEVIEIIRKFFS